MFGWSKLTKNKGLIAKCRWFGIKFEKYFQRGSIMKNIIVPICELLIGIG